MNASAKRTEAEVIVHLSSFGFMRLVRGWPVLVLFSALMLAALTGLGIIGSSWLATGHAFLGPSFAHPLGTNALGQDLLAHSCQALLALVVGVLPPEFARAGACTVRWIKSFVLPAIFLKGYPAI